MIRNGKGGLVALCIATSTGMGCGPTIVDGPGPRTVRYDHAVPGHTEERSADSTATQETNEANHEETETIASPDAFALFEEQVYPVLATNCQENCHGDVYAPLLANPDSQLAYDALLKAKKVDTSTPENSRIYLRMVEDRHNCGEKCDDIGASLLEGLKNWQQSMSNSDNDVTVPLITAPLSLADGIEMEREAPMIGTLVFEAETGILGNTMVAVDSAEASGGAFIEVPNADAQIPGANSNTSGVVNYTFEIESPGTYAVFGLVQGVDMGDNSFFISIDGSAPAAWGIPITMDDWQWDQANTGNGMTDLTFELAAGMHTLQIKQREDGSRLDAIAITDDLEFQGAAVANNEPANVLRFDISALIDNQAEAFLEIEMEAFDEFSYMFRSPKIVLDQGTLSIKGLHILVNDKVQVQAATYTRIEAEIAAPGANLSPAAMIVPMGDGPEMDKITFEFDAMEWK